MSDKREQREGTTHLDTPPARFSRRMGLPAQGIQVATNKRQDTRKNLLLAACTPTHPPSQKNRLNRFNSSSRSNCSPSGFARGCCLLLVPCLLHGLSFPSRLRGSGGITATGVFRHQSGVRGENNENQSFDS